MDIYKSIFNKKADDKKMVKVGRLTGLVSLIIAMLIAPQLGNLGQVFQFIQEYTGVVSPGILGVFLMGLFYKKATNNAAIWGVISSIPIAMYFKVAPNGWSNSSIFIDNIPFMHQMLITCLGTIFIIISISYLEGNKEDPKGIKLSKSIFDTSQTFNVSAISIMLITAFLYAIFW
jgi:SSS family solute:Na+ symporter